DLDRFLNDKPILARPVALWERLWLKAKRAPARAFILVLGIAAVLRLAGAYWWDATQYGALQKQARTAYEELGESYLDQGRLAEFAAAADHCLSLGGADSKAFFRLARGFARAAKVSDANQEKYAARAMELLGAAQKAGAINGDQAEQLGKDAAFD